ncbi:hypothetical protein MHK_010190 [Candidatus Magnetomorum sp. HK-1]|nr:hypothetical protein MHK_010190 [Candidatus Magnetomorum sp. HK-1]
MINQSSPSSLDTCSSIGVFFRSEREKQGLDLNDIFQTTKIRPNILEDIENDAFEKISLKSDIFLISFLKSYAQALKLEPDPIIEKYRETLGQTEDTTKKSGMKKFGISPQLLMVSLVIIFFIGAIVVIVPTMKNLFSKKVKKETSQSDIFVGELDNNVDFSYNKPVTFTEHNTAMKKSQIQKNELGQENVKIQTETNTQSPDNEQGVEQYFLRLKAIETTWLKVTVDDQPPNEFMLKPGDVLSKEAKTEFQILLGNATGVEIFLNDKPVELSGRPGQVMTLKLP